MEKKDYYKDYKHEKYAHYRQVKVDGLNPQEVSAESGRRTRFNPKLEKRVIPFEEIKELKLDKYGTLCPQLDTEDYIIVSNYLLDFWGASIGSDAVTLYLHLKRYAYGKRDFCFPDIEIISLKMGKSVNTVKKYLGILEEHHFIAKFNRYDITDNNREVSPFFKIRRYVPLITDEMYSELPKKLRDMHDEFMSEYSELTLTNELTERQAVVNEIVIGKEIIANKETRQQIKAIIEEHDKYEYIMENISEKDRLVTTRIHRELSMRVSKPSYETWISKLVFINIDNGHWVLCCANQFVKDWISNRYEDLIRKISSDTDLIGYEDKFEYHLMDTIIEKMFKKSKA